MSEFKGTKGKWRNTNGYTVWCKVGNSTKTISDCENRTLKGNQEQYNALLISKAPEMLEMLQWFVENFEGVFHEETETDNKVKEAKQLIKQATEL